jgi:hypothetical protein
MNRIHAAVITLIVGGAVAVGGVALSRSGADAAPQAPSQTTVSDQALAQRTAGLDALETSLDKQETTPSPAATPRTITMPATAPGTLSQSDDHDDNDHSGNDDGSGDDD